MSMKTISLIPLVLAATLVAGCMEDKPSDRLAAETLHKSAEGDVVDGLEIANFKRDNGWADADAANRYKVQYAYDLRLTKPYPEVVLRNAQALHEGMMADSKKTGNQEFSVNKIQGVLSQMQVVSTSSQWVADQGDNFRARRNSLLDNCTPCVDFWNAGGTQDEVVLRRSNFISSWIYFEKLGFMDEAKVGDSVPRVVAASFTKTEKGWQPTE